MDGAIAAVYENPIGCGIRAEGCEEEPPRVQVRATRPNLVKLYRKLFLSGRLEVVSRHAVRQNFLNGLFSVVKDMDRDRMILDGRPANLLERKLSTCTASMAAATCLEDIRLNDDEVLLATGEDLRDFFYQFKASSSRTARNTLCQPVSREEAAIIFGTDTAKWDEPIYCGLSSLAMGDTNACEYAQASHLSLCLRYGVILPSELMHMRGVVPRGPLYGGIITDDLVLFERCLRSMTQEVGSDHPFLAEGRIQFALQGYRRHELEHNPKKEFRHEKCSRILGSGAGWGERFIACIKFTSMAPHTDMLPGLPNGLVFSRPFGGNSWILGIYSGVAAEASMPHGCHF